MRFSAWLDRRSTAEQHQYVDLMLFFVRLHSGVQRPYLCYVAVALRIMQHTKTLATHSVIFIDAGNFISSVSKLVWRTSSFTLLELPYRGTSHRFVS